MRGVLVRNVGFCILALALSVFAGCNDNPLGFDVKDSKDILVDPSSMVLSAGRPGKITSRTVNQGLEPTFDQIVAARDPACGDATITIEEDVSLAPTFPPGVFDVTGGSTLGTTCVVLTSGNLSKTVDITLVADAIEVVSAPASVRAGEGGTIVARLIDVDGNDALPYDPLDVGWLSNDADILDLSAGDGTFTTSTSGTSEITLTWTGQEANGTTGTGVVRLAELVIEVGVNVPVSAAFTIGDPLGAFIVGDVDDFDITVVDAQGNRNTLPDEIIDVTVTSSDPLVATAAGRIVTDDVALGAGDVPVIEVTAVGGGATIISGVVQTTAGDLAYSASYFVPAPSITSLSAVSGVFAETITITGEQFSFPGLVTLVYVDGEQLGNFTVVSDTEITAQMPTYADPSAGHLVVVNVNGIESTEVITWEQTNSCVAQDFPDEAGFDGPFVPVSLPLECNGTLAGPQDDWFFTDVSVDALGGGSTISATLAPEWTAVKDIDWFYCTAAFACTFAIDELPSTFTQALDAATHVWVADDFAGFGGNATPQPYTVIVTID